jgi:hypothetical protein
MLRENMVLRLYLGEDACRFYTDEMELGLGNEEAPV